MIDHDLDGVQLFPLTHTVHFLHSPRSLTTECDLADAGIDYAIWQTIPRDCFLHCSRACLYNPPDIWRELISTDDAIQCNIITLRVIFAIFAMHRPDVTSFSPFSFSSQLRYTRSGISSVFSVQDYFLVGDQPPNLPPHSSSTNCILVDWMHSWLITVHAPLESRYILPSVQLCPLTTGSSLVDAARSALTTLRFITVPLGTSLSSFSRTAVLRDVRTFRATFKTIRRKHTGPRKYFERDRTRNESVLTKNISRMIPGW